MAHLKAQITTRSGPPGTKDVTPVVHGEFDLHKGRTNRGLLAMLGNCMEAAAQVGQDGMVTEVAVLIYPASAVPQVRR